MQLFWICACIWIDLIYDDFPIIKWYIRCIYMPWHFKDMWTWEKKTNSLCNANCRMAMNVVAIFSTFQKRFIWCYKIHFMIRFSFRFKHDILSDIMFNYMLEMRIKWNNFGKLFGQNLTKNWWKLPKSRLQSGQHKAKCIYGHPTYPKSSFHRNILIEWSLH